MSASFADSIGSGFVSAFEVLGVEPDMARRGAAGYSTVSTWVDSQTAQAAVGGGLASAIPGIHHLGAIPDLALVMHKIAIMTWGIGYKKGCPVDGKLDLANVLALWSGAASDDVLAVGTVGGIVVAGSVASGGASAFAVKVAAKVAGKAAGIGATALLTELGAKGAGKVAGAVAGPIASAAMKAAAPYIGATLAAKFGAKQFAGWIPVVGAVVAGGVNVWVMTGVADAAKKYYTAKAAA